MTEQQQPPNPTGNTVSDEFRNLGKNLEELLRALWESEERQKVESDISAGLHDVSESLKKAAADISQSETGQRIKTEVKDFNQRLETGEVKEKVRSDVLNALQHVNTELEKAANRWKERSEPKE